MLLILYLPLLDIFGFSFCCGSGGGGGVGDGVDGDNTKFVSVP